MQLVRLRVLTAFNVYRVGDIIERVPGSARSMLAARWYGRPLVELEAQPATTQLPEPEPAAPSYRKSKRGRT